VTAALRAMTETGATLRRCTRCGNAKPADAFYRRSGTKLLLSECKDCMKARNKTHKHVAPDVSNVPTENDLIAVLAAQGVPAIPGKALSQKWVDVVAWGCVNIEVKSAYAKDGRKFLFRLTAKQKANGVRGDLIVLVCKHDSGNTYHVFHADDPIFFRDGKRRETLPYTFQARRYSGRTRKGVPLNPLTDERMERASRAWGLIETIRLGKSAALRAENLRQSVNTSDYFRLLQVSEMTDGATRAKRPEKLLPVLPNYRNKTGVL
jgi:hypothetical protein